MRLLRTMSLVLSVTVLLSPRSRAEDRVTYFDRTQKKEVSLGGTIDKESPAGISIGGKVIPATDVIDIVYDVLKGESKLNYNAGVNKEKAAQSATKESDRRKNLADALSAFKDALKTTPATAAPARRLMQYRILTLNARQTEDEGGSSDAVLKELTDYATKNRDGWEVVPTLRTIARLQLKSKDTQGAIKTYQELAQLPNIAKEAQQDAELQIVDVLMQAKETYPQAEQKLKTIIGALPADDPQRAKAQVYLARCTAVKGKTELQKAVQELQQTIDRSSDTELKAVAYNTLGDCYVLNGQPRDAMWAYLFVDLVYNQNKEQQAKAVSQLATVFAELKDEKRAKEYQERAKR